MTRPRDGYQDNNTAHNQWPTPPGEMDTETGALEAAEGWYRIGFRKPLARMGNSAQLVMVVAHTRIEGGWSAYIGSADCEALDLNQIAEAVADYGQRLKEHEALLHFPQFGEMEYRS